MSYKSSSSTAINSNSITIPAPAGVVAGDRLLVFIAVDNASAVTITPPSGWISIGSTTQGTPDGVWTEAFEVKNATGSESYVFGSSVTKDITGIAICLAGRSNSDAATIIPTINATAISPPISVTLSGVTATQGADIIALLSMDSQDVANTYSYSDITNYTTRITRDDAWVSVALFTRDNVSAGSTGDLNTVATRLTGGGWAGYAGFVIAIPFTTININPIKSTQKGNYFKTNILSSISLRKSNEAKLVAESLLFQPAIVTTIFIPKITIF